MSFISAPSFPTLPDGMLSASEQADVLHELCTEGPMAITEAAAVMKIPRARGLQLSTLWTASTELRQLIHQHHVAPEASALLAAIEEHVPALALRLARAYVRRQQTTAGLRELLRYLSQHNQEAGRLVVRRRGR